MWTVKQVSDVSLAVGFAIFAVFCGHEIRIPDYPVFRTESEAEDFINNQIMTGKVK